MALTVSRDVAGLGQRAVTVFVVEPPGLLFTVTLPGLPATAKLPLDLETFVAYDDRLVAAAHATGLEVAHPGR